MKFGLFVSAACLLLAAPAARAEGAFPPPGTAATAISLGADAGGDHAGGGAFVFRNPGTASQRLLLPASDVDCTPDGRGASRSRPGQFTIAGGAELPCTATPGSHRFTAVGTEGGSVHQVSGKLVVR